VYASSNGYPFDATLGIGGWLDLTQQGLSPCKKYKASWRSSAKNYRIIDLVYLYLMSNVETPFLLYFVIFQDPDVYIYDFPIYLVKWWLTSLNFYIFL
jgi:hypothetical protein